MLMARSINISGHFGQTKHPLIPVGRLWLWLSADAPSRKHGTQRALLTMADIPSKQVFEAALCQSLFTMALILQIHPICISTFTSDTSCSNELLSSITGCVEKYFLLFVLGQMSKSTNTLSILHRLGDREWSPTAELHHISVVSFPG